MEGMVGASCGVVNISVGYIFFIVGPGLPVWEASSEESRLKGRKGNTLWVHVYVVGDQQVPQQVGSNH